MKKLKVTKVIASSLIIASVLALNPIGASAAWKQDGTGFWYTEGNSYLTGWHPIDGKWYYFDSNGYMAKNTTIEGCQLGSDGAWVVTTPIASTTTTSSTISDSVAGIYYWDKDLKHSNFQKSDYGDYSYSNVDKKVYDNLNNEYTNFLTLKLWFITNKDNYNCYIEFPLNGEFKQFKSKLGLTKEYQENLHSGKVKIYLDDEEVYDTELKSGDFLKDIDINLTGKKKIKFYFDATNSSNKYVEIGFFNGQFIK